MQILKVWKQKLSFFRTVLLELLNDVIFSPKYFISQQSRYLFLRSRQRQAWKISTGSSGRPEIVPKSDDANVVENSFQYNRYFVVKNCWSKRKNRQDKTGSKKKFSGNICLYYLTNCLREYDLNFTFKMVSVPKGNQEKLT